MLKFNELSEQVKTKAVEGFVTAAKTVLGDTENQENEVQEFLSFSRVHRFNQEGRLIGKIKEPNGKEQFVPGSNY